MDEFYLNIKFLKDGIKVPYQSNDGDAGFDVFSPVDYTIFSKSDYTIPLGFACEFPKNYCLLFRNKSGRATKDKLMVGADVIDSTYRGEVHAHLFNLSNKSINILKGEKITQFLVVPIWHGKIQVVNEINMNTTRGVGGFGSTGLK